MKRILTDDGEHTICPHCISDDLDPVATRCPHCGGSIGNSQMRKITAAIIILALTIGGAIVAVNGINNGNRKACEDVNAQNAEYGIPPRDC